MKEILFVFGAARSGTTLVNNLLRKHYGYGMCAEGQWVGPISKQLHRYGDLSEDANLRRLIDDVSEVDMLVHFRNVDSKRRGGGRDLDVTPEMIWDALPERSYGGVVYAVFACVAEQLGADRIGNKNPLYSACLPLLDSMFPTQAKYLHVIRDGRDVALSTMEQTWGQSTAYACAKHWAQTCDNVESFRRTIAAERLFDVGYEDLLRNPRKVTSELADFLGTPLDAATREALLVELTKGAMGRNLEKWKSHMSPASVRRFEAVAGRWLDHHGYERGHPGATSAWYEGAWFMGREYARRIRSRLFRQE